MSRHSERTTPYARSRGNDTAGRQHAAETSPPSRAVVMVVNTAATQERLFALTPAYADVVGLGLETKTEIRTSSLPPGIHTVLVPLLKAVGAEIAAYFNAQQARRLVGNYSGNWDTNWNPDRWPDVGFLRYPETKTFHVDPRSPNRIITGFIAVVSRGACLGFVAIQWSLRGTRVNMYIVQKYGDAAAKAPGHPCRAMYRTHGEFRTHMTEIVTAFVDAHASSESEDVTALVKAVKDTDRIQFGV